MKLVSSTVIVGVLSLLGTAAPGVEAANRHAGTRRQLDLQDAQSAGTLQKRVPLAARELPPIQVGPKLRMIRRGSLNNVKRAPLANAEPSPNAAFGAVPMMNPGTAPIVGMVAKRGGPMQAHNGEQGTAVEVSYATTNNSPANSSSGGSSSSSSSGSSNGSNTSSSSGSDDDDEECDAEDDDDDDDEDCDETDEDDDEEDCDDDADDSTSTSSSNTSSGSQSSSNSSSSDTATASTGSSDSSDSSTASTENVKVALKVPNSGSSSSASSSNDSGSATSSSSASASQSTGSSSSSSGSSNGQTFTGISTWYTQNGNAGACGKVNPDSAHIIALYTSAYANGANCGRTVEIQNLDDGTSTTATVADECPSCGGPGDIDLSVGTFSAIDPQYQTHGVRNIKWWYTD